MTKLEQAARQALEAIGDCSPNKALVKASYALQEALAGDILSPTEQAQQESVAERKAQVNELIKESARLIASISDEGDRYLTAIDTLHNAYRLGLKDAAHEREECAKVCEERADSYKYATDPWALEHIMEAQYCAAAIRARSNK